MNIQEVVDSPKPRCPVSLVNRTRAWHQDTNIPNRKSDDDVISEVQEWMKKSLPCVAGRREYNRGNYMLQIATRKSVPAIVSKFRQALEMGEAVACLFIFNDSRYYRGKSNVGDAFTFLAEQMSEISTVPAVDLANGAALTTSIELTCPVTNLRTVYDDFECIAFCPQSDDEHDKLYDPLMAMPYPCVNMSSDVFGFSHFVRTSALSSWNCEVYQQENLEKIEKLFRVCVERWQRVATMTICNYEAVTNTNLCPVHISPDGDHWVAGHKDPAFAEQMKSAHKHELPSVYGRRIVEGWMDYFRDGHVYRADGMARDGLPIEAI